MLLSEAIRLGAVLRPQARGLLFLDGGSCALGAAAEAVGLSTVEVDARLDGAELRYDQLLVLFPILCCEAIDPTDGNPYGIHNIITVLNDFHEWTREEIAAWVAGIEAQQADAVAVSAVEVAR